MMGGRQKRCEVQNSVLVFSQHVHCPLFGAFAALLSPPRPPHVLLPWFPGTTCPGFPHFLPDLSSVFLLSAGSLRVGVLQLASALSLLSSVFQWLMFPCLSGHVYASNSQFYTLYPISSSYLAIL